MAAITIVGGRERGLRVGCDDDMEEEEASEGVSAEEGGREE